ncbi:hypothetical protein MAMC_01142 [Methylacidimicrobium cyclopophantes]|uniref:Polysaccharide biosynthesis protein C-terminal domain-containing protein n=2 Tax=Methylacidimicrobium cyclopophantes TaxID=1041766 RepID=A0A5E6MM99_9BACT|nr:hypothetical protein MAMC_01142 [Methylacidimicrobium cyclopophantes]
MMDRVARHGRGLGALFASNLVGYGGNFLCLLLIVTHCPVDVFAAYTVAQAVQALAAGWFDAGLGSSIQTLVARGGPESAGVYRSASWRWTLATVPSVLLVLALGSFSLPHWERQPNPFLSPYLLTGFVGVGLIQARVLLASSLAFAEGRIDRFCLLQGVASLGRLLLVLLLLWLRGTLAFSSLLLVEAGAASLTWGVASWAKRPAVDSFSPAETLAARQRLRDFLLPSMPSVFLGGLASTVTLFGGSLFAAPAAIASYGIFQKVGQLVVFAWGPINQYVGRHLCVQSSRTRRGNAERRYLLGALAGYVFFAMVMMGIYVVAGRCSQHYSLLHPLAFALYLVGLGGGLAYVSLDTVLASRGAADHRLAGAFLVAIRTALVAILRPSGLVLLIALDTFTLFPVIGYFLYRLARPPLEPEDVRLQECLSPRETK